jgi:multidrug efflux pump subunit AcrA (membrane-fusion protein)
MIFSMARGESPAMLEISGFDVQNCIVRYAEEIQLPALASGRIEQVFVKDNQSVDFETPIMRLDDRSMLIRRQAQQLRLDAARRQAVDDVDLRYAETALAEAQEELDASRSVQKDFSGAVSSSQLRRLRLAVQRGGVEVERAKKLRLDAATAVDLQEAELAVLEDQLQHLQIKSSLAGVVVKLSKHAGEWVQTGETVATIARLDRVHVNAIIDAANLPADQILGLRVSVYWRERSDSDEQALSGHIISVDPQVLPGGKFRVHAEIINEAISPDRRVAGSTNPGIANTTNQISPIHWKLRPGAEVRMKVYLPTEIAQRFRFSRQR